MRNVYRILITKPEGRGLCWGLGIDRMIILKWILKETGCEGMEWSYLAQWWALVNMVMNLHILLKMKNFLTSWSTVSFWTRTQHCKVNCFDFVLRELEPARCRLPVYCMIPRVPDTLFVVCFDGSFIMTTRLCAGWLVQCRSRQWICNLRNLHKKCVAPESSRPYWWA